MTSGATRGRIPLEEGAWWLLLDKPAGMTSHDVVDRVRRATGEKRVGHAGTLDPMATGLLVVAVGRAATRKLGDSLAGDKEYRATARLGLVSPTGDDDAPWTLETTPPPLREEDLSAGLEAIRRRGRQVPPMVSALKREGVALHKLARRGWWLMRDAREAQIEALELERYSPETAEVTFRVAGGGGLYVRAIVRDLGVWLAVPAALTALRRTRVGPFHVDDAIGLNALDEDAAKR